MADEETPISELFARDPLQLTLTPEEARRVVEKFKSAAALFAAGVKPERKKRETKAPINLIDF